MFFFFFKQKTAYEMRISDWSSDVCSSDLGRDLPRHLLRAARRHGAGAERRRHRHQLLLEVFLHDRLAARLDGAAGGAAAPGRMPRPELLHLDRKSVVEGKRVSVSVDLGGRRIIKKKQTKKNKNHIE